MDRRQSDGEERRHLERAVQEVLDDLDNECGPYDDTKRLEALWARHETMREQTAEFFRREDTTVDDLKQQMQSYTSDTDALIVGLYPFVHETIKSRQIKRSCNPPYKFTKKHTNTPAKEAWKRAHKTEMDRLEQLRRDLQDAARKSHKIQADGYCYGVLVASGPVLAELWGCSRPTALRIMDDYCRWGYAYLRGMQWDTGGTKGRKAGNEYMLGRRKMGGGRWPCGWSWLEPECKIDVTADGASFIRAADLPEWVNVPLHRDDTYRLYYDEKDQRVAIALQQM